MNSVLISPSASRLNPTVVVLKRVALPVVVLVLSRLNPTVVVLKPDPLRTRPSRGYCLNPTVVVLKRVQSRFVSRRPFESQSNRSGFETKG